MILQLDPVIPLDTPKGPASAVALIDYSPSHGLIWVCFIDATGECWSYNNREVRAQKNITMGVRTQ